MTSAERKSIYAALAAAFPDHCIQRTDGQVTGRGYDTAGIGYQYIANRLNEVLGVGGYRAHRTVLVKEIPRPNGRMLYEAICDITLELGEWVDGEFVVFAESLADGGHVAPSEADARKGAFTNAFKKAAAFHGVGRQAYEGTLDDDNFPASTVETPVPGSSGARVHPLRAGRREPAAAMTVQQPPAAQGHRYRLSSKQASALQALARKLGLDQASLRALSRQEFGALPEFLSREQASQLITALSGRLASGVNAPGARTDEAAEG